MHRAFGGDRPAPPAEGYVSISLTAPEASQRLLRECATSRMVHVTRLLAIEGIDVNVKDARGRPALVVAATHGVDAVVTALIEAGAEIDATSPDGTSAAFAASSFGHADALKALVSAACDVDKARNDGQTPAYAAAGAGHGEALDLLLEAGCDIDRALPGKAATPLLAAAFNGRARVARALLQAGADPNKCAADGTSALMVASWHGDAAVVRALLDVGADASRVRNIDGATALYLAAQANHVPVVELLLERGRADPSAPGGPCRSTPLIVAAERGHVASVRTLLTAGANPNAADATGWTAGHAACQGGHVAALNALLSARADPNARAAPDGCTPALIAAQQNHAGCLDALAARGADLDAPYLTGHQSTPFIMSAHNDAADAARALAARGADVRRTNAYGATSVAVAAALGHADVLQVLLRVDPRGAQTVDQNGAAPLHVAAARGRTSSVAALLRAGAPADATWRGLTPIDIARRNGHGHVVRLLATRAIDAGGTSANEVTPDDAPRHLRSPMPSPCAAGTALPPS
jgi:ankyrin repeat protein